MKAKQAFFSVAGLFMLLLAAFAFTACPSNSGFRGGSGEVTVTFVSNGGSAVDPVTVAIGGFIERPPDPELSDNSGVNKGRFRGWYEDDRTFETRFNFGNRVEKDTILYADWGYRPGDTGPGSGKIFYRNETGFTMSDDNSNNPVTMYYLEAAPEDEPTPLWFAPLGQLPGSTEALGYVRRIGGGRENTNLMLVRIPSSPAANACKSASHNGLQDWFLPSRAELAALYQARNFVGNLRTEDPPHIYLTSNQFDYQFFYVQNFNTGIEGTEQNNAPYLVRAIRAF